MTQSNRRIALGVSLLCVGLGVGLMVATAQPQRPEQWKKVDDAVKKGLPKTAIKELEPIIKSALDDKAYPEAIKAVCKKIVLEANIEGNKPEEKITRMQTVIGTLPAETHPVLNAVLGHWGTRTIGASGAVYGLLLAFGVLYPNQTVLFNFLFPIKAKYLVMIYGAVAFLGALRINSGVSHIAHLGGMAFGYAYLRLRFAAFDWGEIRRQYQTWKLQRAKKRFQVYMRKHGSDRDPWTH